MDALTLPELQLQAQAQTQTLSDMSSPQQRQGLKKGKSPGGSKQKKQSKIRQRRGSDALPPWPAMNGDIVCPHGALSLAQGPRNRRRAIASRYWHFLRRFYPEGPAFKCATAPECASCCSSSAEAKASAVEKREAELSLRRSDLVSAALTALSLRRCGLPMHCVAARVSFYNDLAEGAEGNEGAERPGEEMLQQRQVGSGRRDGGGGSSSSGSDVDGPAWRSNTTTATSTGALPRPSRPTTLTMAEALSKALPLTPPRTHIPRALAAAGPTEASCTAFEGASLIATVEAIHAADSAEAETEAAMEAETEAEIEAETAVGESMRSGTAVSTTRSSTGTPPVSYREAAAAAAAGAGAAEQYGDAWGPDRIDSAAQADFLASLLSHYQTPITDTAATAATATTTSSTTRDPDGAWGGMDSYDAYLAALASLEEYDGAHDIYPSRTPISFAGIESRFGAVTDAGAESASGIGAQSAAGIGNALVQPLVPGLYNLVPKQWLKQWRRYLKDPSVSALPPLDCTQLMCQAHGLLVLPPHLEEYLLGLRRSLLGGLGAYPGPVVELVTAEEWDELQAVLHDGGAAADCSLRLCLDGEGVSWNIGLCSVCDPFGYSALSKHIHGRKPSPNTQQGNGVAADIII